MIPMVAMHESVAVIFPPARCRPKVGETEAAIRDTFEHAQKSAPAVILFDEIDAIPTRPTSANTSPTIGLRTTVAAAACPSIGSIRGRREPDGGYPGGTGPRRRPLVAGQRWADGVAPLTVADPR
jgi:hypothetical protein